VQSRTVTVIPVTVVLSRTWIEWTGTVILDEKTTSQTAVPVSILGRKPTYDIVDEENNAVK
jgi:hypothetical protein